MFLQVDLAWLLDIAHQEIPGDPEVMDWGALEAARARHGFRVMEPALAQSPGPPGARSWPPPH
ncbi:hypothetical protein ACH4XT_26170 [Streptomyces avidinii]|uniref:hypothetical protein n=1 Tax=Streptomyces avidinii TaxID=1895 RepID=UPI0037B90DBB